MKAIKYRLTEDQKRKVSDNVKLAYKATDVFRRGFPAMTEEEITSACYEGLCHAARKYDPMKGAYSTYAFEWMLAVVRRDACNLTTVAVPEYLTGRKGSKKRNPELVAFAEQATRVEARDPNVRFNGNEEINRHPESGPKALPGPDPQVHKHLEDKEEVERFLCRMLPSERDVVVRSIWGGQTFRAIGEDRGLSGERVRQLYEGGLSKARLAVRA